MFGLGTLLLAFVVPPAPSPRPAILEIAWTAPQECPDEDALRQRVLELAPLDPDGDGTLFVDGVVEASDGAFELRLRTRLGDLEDERSIRDPDCDAVVQAAALFVSVSVDPYTETSTPQPQPPSEPDPVPLEEEPPRRAPVTRAGAGPAEPQTSAAIPSRRQTRLVPERGFVALAPQLEFGALPGISGGPRLTVGAQWRRASVGVHALYGAPRQTDVVLGASGLAQMGAAGVVGCGNPLEGDLRLPLCFVFEAGGIHVGSRGLEPANQLVSPWVATGARVGIERRWGRVGAFSAAEALVPVMRTDVLLGGESSFSTWAASLRLVVGLKIFFATESA
ncbi:MAG: hypothetical protein ACRBN8_32670 [Nannocystales bacterium]